MLLNIEFIIVKRRLSFKVNKKKIVIIGIIYSFLVVFSLTNMYVNMEYNLNVFEYIKKSLPFTEEEKSG